MTLSLMPHQIKGKEWLTHQKRGLLAFEPGCGKTLTTLETLKHTDVKDDLTLIVAPTPLLGVWVEEMQKWYQTSPVMLRGGPAKRKELYSKIFKGYYVISYETLRQDIKIIREIKWDAVVLDESSKIQSPTAKITKAILSLKPVTRIALNGTPISNGWQDLWAVMTWIEPLSLYGNFYKFRAIHAVMNPNFPAIESWRDTETIKRRIAPWIMWAKKTEVLKDLPPCDPQSIRVTLSAPERKVYERIREELLVKIEGEDIPISNALVEMTRLRQAANGLHAFEEGNTTSSKFEAISELLASVPEGEKVIVFSMYKQTINALTKSYKESNAVSITGDTPTKQREENLHSFINSKKTKCLFGTDAISKGLNLQCASYVINIDLPWSYASYDQRIGRAWRAGQTKSVTVWNIMADNTVDGHVAKLLSRKIQTADDAAGVTRQDLLNILQG